jgi:hypothetical protein
MWLSKISFIEEVVQITLAAPAVPVSTLLDGLLHSKDESERLKINMPDGQLAEKLFHSLSIITQADT